jgi:hypothetical protein
VLQHLSSWSACPTWVLEEGRFDASEEVRELVGGGRDNLTGQ